MIEPALLPRPPAENGYAFRLAGLRDIWCAPYRPLFLLAALSALIVPGVWWLPDSLAAGPIARHAHELLFGMGGAAVGGYLLTALPAWTGTCRVSPMTSMTLSLVWLAARASFLLRGIWPGWPLTIGALAYFIVLAVVLARLLLAARLLRKAWVVGAVIALAIADLALMTTSEGSANSMFVMVVLLFALLISLIGGRVVPAFTIRWMGHSRVGATCLATQYLAALSNTALVAGCVLLVCDLQALAGLCVMAAGLSTLVRAAMWRPLRTVRYPALLVLHLAWLWLPVGLLAAGFSWVWPALLRPSDAVHGLTMGAMGTMILAMMGRASMRRDGRLLRMSGVLALAFALVWISALWRIAGPSLLSDPAQAIRSAAVVWMAGWLLFLCDYIPALWRPVPRPVFSAARTP